MSRTPTQQRSPWHSTTGRTETGAIRLLLAATWLDFCEPDAVEHVPLAGKRR